MENKDQNGQKMHKSTTNQLTCENLDGVRLWSLMEDQAIHAHLKQEAHKVADLIAKDWDSQKMHKSTTNQLTCENLDGVRFWSLMEDKTIHAHLKEEAYKVADLITRSSKNHPTMASETFTEGIGRGQTGLKASEVSIRPATERSYLPIPRNRKIKQLQQLSSPVQSLDHIFSLLGSDDRQQKMEGLRSIQDLTKSRPEELRASLQRVYVAVMQEVKHLDGDRDTIKPKICLDMKNQRATSS